MKYALHFPLLRYGSKALPLGDTAMPSRGQIAQHLPFSLVFAESNATLPEVQECDSE